MLTTSLRPDLVDEVAELLRLGEPYVTVRDRSDYRLDSALFASICPVVVDDEVVIGAVIAMRGQDYPADVCVQDVVVFPSPSCRRRGVGGVLVGSVAARARIWGCRRLFRNCARGNTVAFAAWQQLGFRNLRVDHTVDGVRVIADYQGPGQGRAVFQLHLWAAGPLTQPASPGADA